MLAEPTATGIMVKGPPGIGKSHSLVNLFHKLVYGSSNNKYLVTFIPDCEKLSSAHALLDAIRASSGISGKEIKQQIFKDNDVASYVVANYVLTNFITSIDDILRSSLPTRQDPGPETGRQPCITRRAMCKDSIICLKDLQWPDGCSLHSSQKGKL